MNCSIQDTPFNQSGTFCLNNTTFAAGNNETFIPYNERPETYVVPALFFIIFVLGVMGNGTLVVIFLRHRTMRNVPNTYILSLAVADLLVIVISMPFTSIIYTVDSWPWGELICKISEAAKDISTGVSVFTLTALSADRFFAIVDPLKKFHTGSGGKKATRITFCIAISIWILAIVFSVPAFMGSFLKTLGDPNGKIHFVVCYPYPPWLNDRYAQIMVLLRFLILYVIPLTIIGIFYLNMANHLIVSTRNVPGEVQGTLRQIRARKKVAITVLVFVLVFAVCFLPTHMYMLFFYFHPNFNELYNAFWHYLRIIGFCLFYLNSCANPIALYWVSGAFRKHFNRYLLCIKQKRSSRNNTYQGQQATTISYVPSRRSQQAMMTCSRKNNRRLQDAAAVGGAGDTTQEIFVTLLGPENEHMCSKM